MASEFRRAFRHLAGTNLASSLFRGPFRSKAVTGQRSKPSGMHWIGAIAPPDRAAEALAAALTRIPPTWHDAGRIAFRPAHIPERRIPS